MINKCFFLGVVYGMYALILLERRLKHTFSVTSTEKEKNKQLLTITNLYFK